MKWTSIALLALLAGCDMGYDYPAPPEAQPPVDMLGVALKLAADDAVPYTVSPTVALAVLLREGIITPWRWEPLAANPDTQCSGTAFVDHYEFHLRGSVYAPEMWMLNYGKNYLTLEIRGVTQNGTAGCWSDWSDTLSFDVPSAPGAN